MERIRIYGKVVNTWKATEEYTRNGETFERPVITQYEIAYKEYDEDGNLVGIGTEDFSRERYRTIDRKQIWTWDGQKRNKGGHRWFDYEGDVTCNLNQLAAVRKLMEKKYNKAAMVQLRTI